MRNMFCGVSTPLLAHKGPHTDSPILLAPNNIEGPGPRPLKPRGAPADRFGPALLKGEELSWHGCLFGRGPPPPTRAKSIEAWPSIFAGPTFPGAV